MGLFHPLSGERGGTIRDFKDWFWRPPRPHGATIQDRDVTSLELFYDLVYVAVISQAAHQLAEHVEARTVVEFAIVFSMIWWAWINGSLYLEIHGRHDGRTRSFVFLEMGILVLLAVFTAGAAGERGGAFAIVYALLFALMGWLWYSVRGQDAAQYRTLTGMYVAGMAISVAVVLVSALLAVDARLAVWAAFALAWIVAYAIFARMREFEVAIAPTRSMIERFGLFTIIVLGEVVIGVVSGLSESDQDVVTIATGLLGLFVGFGFWWSYFDIVGRRMPKTDGPSMVSWILSHLPITMAIAAAGAGMTSLITHATDPRTPPEIAWLIGGAVAIGLLAVGAAGLALDDARRLHDVYRKIAVAMVVAAALSVTAGWLQPTPWVLAAILGAILVGVWLVAIGRFMSRHAWSELDDESEDRERDAAPPRVAPT